MATRIEDQALMDLRKRFEQLANEMRQYEDREEDLDEIPEAMEIDDRMEDVANQMSRLSAGSVDGLRAKAHVALHYAPHMLQSQTAVLLSLFRDLTETAAPTWPTSTAS